jgi:hypothetical protein
MEQKRQTAEIKTQNHWCNWRAIPYRGLIRQNLPARTFLARQAMPQGFFNRSLLN